ncbi:hypothetical protein M2146_001053 [Lachnospiraceae bacterium PF1-22]
MQSVTENAEEKYLAWKKKKNIKNVIKTMLVALLAIITVFSGISKTSDMQEVQAVPEVGFIVKMDCYNGGTNKEEHLVGSLGSFTVDNYVKTDKQSILNGVSKELIKFIKGSNGDGTSKCKIGVNTVNCDRIRIHYSNLDNETFEIYVYIGTENSESEDGKITISDEHTSEDDIKKAIRTDPDGKSFFISSDLEDDANEATEGKGTSIADKMFEALDAIIEWGLEKCEFALDEIVLEFAEQFGPNIGIYDGENVSYITTVVGADPLKQTEIVFVNIGYYLLVIISMLSLFFIMIIPGEFNLLGTIGRILGASFLVFSAKEILQYMFSLTWGLMSIVRDNMSSSSKVLDSTGFASLTESNTEVWKIFQLIFYVMILFNLFKLLLEIVERYLVVVLLYYVSPVAFATAASKGTSPIAMSFFKMLCSMLFIMIMNVWFLNIIGFAISNGSNVVTDQSTTMEVLTYYFTVLGLIKIAQKIDEFMNNMGMSVATTGGSLASSAMGVYAGLKTATGMVKGAVSAGKGVASAGSKLGRKAVDPTGAKGISGKNAKSVGEMLNEKRGITNTVDKNGSITKLGAQGFDNLRPGQAISNEAMQGMYGKQLSQLGGAGGKLVAAEMVGKGPGMALGSATLQNKDGSISTAKLSTLPMNGATQLVAPDKNGKGGLYAKTSDYNAPIGGTGFDGLHPKTPSDVFENTGNFSNDSLSSLGFVQDNHNYNDLAMRPIGNNTYAVYDTAKSDELLGLAGYGMGDELNMYYENGNVLYGKTKARADDYIVPEDFKESYNIDSNYRPEPDDYGIAAQEGFMRMPIDDKEDIILKDPVFYDKQKNDEIVQFDDREWYVEKGVKRNAPPEGRREDFEMLN